MKPTLTQKKIILGHLQRVGSIEPHTSLYKYGVYRLAAVICILRKEGYNIVTERMESINSHTGEPCCYANYRLIQD